MKSFKILLLLFFFIFLNIKATQSLINYKITLFFYSYPEINIAHRIKKNILQQPHYLSDLNFLKDSKKSYNSFAVPGITCFYQGYFTQSLNNGELEFLKKQSTRTIYLIITKQLKPNFIIGPNLVSNFKLVPSIASKIYKIKFKEDKKLNLFYFETSLEKTLPTHYAIPLNSIIILGDPASVIMSEGATITSYTPNLTLPNVYIKNPKKFVTENAINSLALKEYFEKESFKYKLADIAAAQNTESQKSKNGQTPATESPAISKNILSLIENN